MAVIIILIIAVIIAAVIGGTIWHLEHRRQLEAEAKESAWPGLLPTEVNKASDPAFFIQNTAGNTYLDPGFTIVSRTAGHTRPFKGNERPRVPGPHVGDFYAVEVSENPTAICKLTGKEVNQCTCDKHKAKTG